jgi:hypothetical protein
LDDLDFHEFSNFKWSASNADNLQSVFSSPTISSRLNTLWQSSEKDGDILVEDFTSIVLDASEIAMVRKKRRKIASGSKPINKSIRKPWFSAECHKLSKDIKKLGKRLSDRYDHCSMVLFRAKRKEYKKLLNNTKRNFRVDILNQLDQLHSSDPSAYWKLFDKLKSSNVSNRRCPVSGREFNSYFNDLLNELPGNKLNVCDIDKFIIENRNKVFNELNFSISNDEISAAISRSKNGKASGIDYILNEMLKATEIFILPCLNKIFNRILSDAIYPASWRCNILSAIHKKGDNLLSVITGAFTV